MELQKEKQRGNDLAKWYRSGKLKEKYYLAIRSKYNDIVNKCTKVKQLTDKKLMRLILNELGRYRDRRQETNADKALAYLKWRSSLMRKVLNGPRGWR